MLFIFLLNKASYLLVPRCCHNVARDVLFYDAEDTKDNEYSIILSARSSNLTAKGD